jgi:hypothetical protein
MVNALSPHHYAKWAIEPITFIMENEVPFAEGNVIKYTMRHRDKNGVQDIDKAIRYLEMIKEHEYGVKSPTKTQGISLGAKTASFPSHHRSPESEDAVDSGGVPEARSES